MRRRIGYGITALALVASLALLWDYREPRRVPPETGPFLVEDLYKGHQELEKVGIERMRARAAEATARLEKQREIDQLKRQNTYVIVILIVILASVTIVALVWAYLRRWGRDAVSVEQGSPPD